MSEKDEQTMSTEIFMCGSVKCDEGNNTTSLCVCLREVKG